LKSYDSPELYLNIQFILPSTYTAHEIKINHLTRYIEITAAGS